MTKSQEERSWERAVGTGQPFIGAIVYFLLAILGGFLYNESVHLHMAGLDDAGKKILERDVLDDAGQYIRGGDIVDDTSQKIIDAAMALIRDKGYVATTTKEIARAAGVNECTLFRKFGSKKEIVLEGVKQAGWRADVTPEIFQNVTWELEADMEMFMRAYMDRMTPDFVNLSIGLRAPQLYEETAPLIMKVPQAFLATFTAYLEKMCDMGKIPEADFDALAMTFFSATFGYTFLRASFGEKLTRVEKETYIKNSVRMFLKGLVQ